LIGERHPPLTLPHDIVQRTLALAIERECA